MNDSSKFAQAKLQATGQAKDKAKVWAWVFLIAGAVLGVLLCLALVDFWVVLPTMVRVGGFVILAGLAGFGVFGWLKLFRQPTTLKEAALDAEEERKDLGCVVSTAAEYITGERQVTKDYEPELVDALEQQAAKKLRQVEVSYRKMLKHPATLLAFAAGTVLLFLAFAPGSWTAVKRTVTPWSTETYTKVEVKPGNVEIPVGKDLSVTNTFTGRMPKNPTLRWRELEQQAWQSVALKTNQEGLYVHSFKGLQTSINYQVTGNDAISEIYEVTTYIPPELQAMRIGIAYPAYTKIKPFEQDSPNVTVLRGTELKFQVTPNTKLARARLKFSDTNEISLTAGPEDAWVGNLSAYKETDYWVELADAKGHTGGNDKAYRIKVFPDKPPKVYVVEPGKDIRAEATNTVNLKLAASDDFGVSELKVVYHKLGGPEQTLNCSFTNAEGGEVMGSVELALSTLNLKPYEVVAYHAEALDNNTLDGPGKGASRVYFIEITNEEGSGGSKSPSGNDGQKVNLLAMQKQIVAETAALSDKSAGEKFKDLATRQKEAAEFAEAYRESVAAMGVPEAEELMKDALQQMQNASGALGEKKRDQAIPPEEKALADLYQVVGMLPKLGQMPTGVPPEQAQNPEMKVVLEALKKMAKNPPSEEELEAMLEQLKELSRSQAGLLQALERTGEMAQAETGKSENGETPGEGKEGQRGVESSENGGNAEKDDLTKAGNGKEGQGEEAQGKEGQGKEGQGKEGQGKQGQGKEGQSKEGEGKQGQGKEGQGKEGQGNESQKSMMAGKGGTGQGKGQAEAAAKEAQEEMQKLAEMEDALSNEALELAKKLSAMAEKDTRLSTGAQKMLVEAAGKMGAAASSMRKGQGSTAGTEGGKGLMGVDKVTAILERLLKSQAKLTDVTAEDFPKEYEALISDYLKKLSHEK